MGGHVKCLEVLGVDFKHCPSMEGRSVDVVGISWAVMDSQKGKQSEAYVQ